MKMFKLQVHHHIDLAIERLLNRALSALIKNQEKIMSALDDLNSKADTLKSAIDAALASMQDVKAKLDAALLQPSLDTTAIQAIADKLDADIAEVNQITAIDAPAAPAPAPEPTPAA